MRRRPETTRSKDSRYIGVPISTNTFYSSPLCTLSSFSSSSSKYPLFFFFFFFFKTIPPLPSQPIKHAPPPPSPPPLSPRSRNRSIQSPSAPSSSRASLSRLPILRQRIMPLQRPGRLRWPMSLFRLEHTRFELPLPRSRLCR